MESSQESDYVDFDEYRKEYESEECWHLRKSFMIHHWDNIDDEEEILCCAQLFVNIELLGCKYAAEIMDKIKLMSDEVPQIQKYRENKQNRLKKTIVTAQKAIQPEHDKTTLVTFQDNKTFRPNYYHTMEHPVTKLFKIDINHKNSNPNSNGWSTIDKFEWDNYVQKSNQVGPSLNIDESIKSKKLKILLRNVIVFEIDDKNDINYCLNKTTACMKKIGKLNIKFNEDTTTYSYVFNDQIIAEGTGESKRLALKAANGQFLKVLRENCYTIRLKNGNKPVDENSNQIQEESHDFKLLSKLGWKGGSLDPNGTGILDHIKLEIKIGRLGLGSENDKFDQSYFQNLLQNFKQSQLEYDLKLSSEFTKEERAVIHQMALYLNLRTKSYGKSGSRHLVVSSPISPQVLRQKLIEGDEYLKEKYELIPPPFVKIVKPHLL
ncbi:NF-kappa-B-repressing factor-like [Chironomus tepperi]|uniref:NF-kappa-B-repressing factor-like n=1 Tax=Chironomus tepperi TaxID=113505 RepID=UPI00391F8FD4